MCVCVCETECCCSVWQCVSCHDVVCTAHCSHTKLYLPHYKSLGREAEKVNKNGKVGWTWAGVGVYVRYYVSHWFYAEVYHILELSCNEQVEAVWVKRFCWYSTKPDSRLWIPNFIFLSCTLERIPAFTCLACGVMRWNYPPTWLTTASFSQSALGIWHDAWETLNLR